MTDRSGNQSEGDEAFAHREHPPHTDNAREAQAPTVFNPKGIGSNVLLTVAAAVVPMVIIGVAGVKTLFGARKHRR